MNALESIIAWAESDLLEWQSDAVRRLLIQDVLTDDDRQEFLLMLKSLYGLLPDEITPPKPQPLQKGMVSGAPISKVNVVLKAIKDLLNINRIPNGSSLSFGHRGLTVIYGENGSGKTGYARVLKRACRARDTKERILPNIYNTETAAPAKATFKLSVDSHPDKEIKWEDGKASDEVLTNITVFDSKCARVIVDDKNDVTYLPYGAHVFEELVNLLRWIKKEVEDEKPNLEPLQWPEITEATKPGIFLASLTYKTSPTEVKDAAVWTEVDAEKLNNLTRRLAELEANDPEKQAVKTSSFKKRVMELKTYVSRRAVDLSDKQLGKFSEMFCALVAAKKAVNLASQATLKNEPLPGAGESAWQILYEAAKDFSTKDAYQASEFPVVDEDSRCVWCMQPLGKDAKQRLIRFKTFMEQEAKKKHEEAKKAWATAVETIEALKDKATADVHANTIDEVKQRNEEAATATEAFLSSIDGRIEYFERLALGSETGELPPLPNDPANALQQTIDELEKEVTDFKNAIDPSERAKLKEEKVELLARKCFAKNQAKILAYLVDLKTAQKCDQATASINTATVTLKGKNVVSEALTPQLKKSIQSELEQLGANHVPLNLKPSGSGGETLHQLELEGVKPGYEISLTEVLSEGEQCVVALAGFLAEVHQGQHSCPIVLDDPVSSLDHLYRAKIAGRLVSESLKRQVLIFTHDIAFLLNLQEKAGELDGVSLTPQTVLKQNKAAGVPGECLPWHVMPVKNRLEYLRAKLHEIKLWHITERVKYDREVAALYGLLRETWEATIEEVVFNKTIIRHGNEVQTMRLKNVEVTTSLYKAIHVNMSKCSMWMIGHDKSKTLDVHRPPPTEFLADLDVLYAFIKERIKDGKLCRRERDAATNPETAEVG